MTAPEPMRPLGAAEYLASLPGPAADGCEVIVALVDRLLLLALDRQADEIGFRVRPDGALDIHLRRGGDWESLPPLASRGSAVSRLFVVGGLEKGEEARRRPQKSHAVIHGAWMVFETEPLGPWKEDVRVRILAGSYSCSGCLSLHPAGAIHVIPAWDDTLGDFVTVFRCDRCWKAALAETRLRTGTPDGEVLAKFCGFLSRQGLGREAEEVRGLRPEAAAGEISRLLDRLESGRLLFGPL